MVADSLLGPWDGSPLGSLPFAIICLLMVPWDGSPLVVSWADDPLEGAGCGVLPLLSRSVVQLG